jgi:hypothetical protein
LYLEVHHPELAEDVYDGSLGADGRRDYNLSRLFATEELQPYGDGQVSRTLDEQFKMLAQPQPPNVEPGALCTRPYDCEGWRRYRSLPIAGCKIETLRSEGITSIAQLPSQIVLKEHFHLTKKECRFALGAKEKGVQISPVLIAELEALRYLL